MGALIGRNEALERAASLRLEFAETAADIDRTGKFPTLNLRRLYEEGLADILVPPNLGGSASDNGTTADLDVLSEIINRDWRRRELDGTGMGCPFDRFAPHI